MYRNFLIGLILMLCVGIVLSCGQAPSEKPSTTEGLKTSGDLQEEVFKDARATEEEALDEIGSPYEKPATKGPMVTPEEEPPPGEDVEEKSAEEEMPGEETTEKKENYDDLIAVVDTNKGTFKIKFYHDTAPKHVENFVKLARESFFDGLTFHRYEPGFVIQGGDPEGTGAGGPGYTVEAEINTKHKHTKGAVASARTGDQINPERRSSGSQWYVCLVDTPHLDGAYTVWGQVITGMDVVMELRQGDVM